MIATLERPTAPLAGDWTFVTQQHQRLYLRRVRHDDAPALADLLLRLSARTRRLRYLAPRRDSLDDAWSEAERICDGHRGDRLGLVAIDPRAWGYEILAVAELVPDAVDPTTAQLAAVVRDDHQAKGIGTTLVRHLLERASGGRLATVRADILAENTAARRLLDRFGLPLTTRTRGGVVEVRVQLKAQPDIPAA